MDGMGEEQHLKGWRKAAKTCLRCCSSSFGPALLRILIPQSINPPLSTVLNSTGDWYLTVALNWSLTWSQSAATYECADCFAQQVDFIICEDLARDRAGICWDSTDVRIAVGAADVPKKKKMNKFQSAITDSGFMSGSLLDPVTVFLKLCWNLS